MDNPAWAGLQPQAYPATCTDPLTWGTPKKLFSHLEPIGPSANWCPRSATVVHRGPTPLVLQGVEESSHTNTSATPPQIQCFNGNLPKFDSSLSYTSWTGWGASVFFFLLCREKNTRYTHFLCRSWKICQHQNVRSVTTMATEQVSEEHSQAPGSFPSSCFVLCPLLWMGRWLPAIHRELCPTCICWPACAISNTVNHKSICHPASFYSRMTVVRTGEKKRKQGGNSVTCSSSLKLTLGNKAIAFPASVITTQPAMNTKDLKNNPQLKMHIDFQ